MIITPIKGIPLIKPGDDISEILITVLPNNEIIVEDNDIFVLAQKIVSKSEGRLINLTEVTPSAKALEMAKQSQKDPRFVELVLRESVRIVRVRPGTLIAEHKSGFICANAGIDHSNVKGDWGHQEDWVLLLPENSDKSARRIQEKLEKRLEKNIGVLIIDSHGRPWRLGTVGMSIGMSGVPGLMDLLGKADLFGYKLRITQIAASDELAGAASLVMGQACEGIPVVHVRNFPYSLRKSGLRELIRPKDQDLFR
jgi:coenzyme F420-0:L-glutamate ligase/coenzyme F420-1:gamma-L-glutamate ligase